MENMKSKIKKHIQNYYYECRAIEAEYAVYETQQARNLYAPMLIQKMLNEKITKLKEVNQLIGCIFGVLITYIWTLLAIFVFSASLHTLV